MLLAVKSDINTAYINVLMAGTVLGTVIIILLFVKEKYLRKDHEDLQQSEKLLSPANASNRGEYIFEVFGRRRYPRGLREQFFLARLP